MDEDFGSSYITIEDEDGNEFELEQLAELEYEGRSYAAFLPADMDEDDPDYDEDETLWRVRSTGDEEDADGKEVHFYLVNTSGSMVRNSSSSKDGDDYKFEVDDYEIVSVTLED